MLNKLVEKINITIKMCIQGIVVLIHEGGQAARQQYVFIDSRACRE